MRFWLLIAEMNISIKAIEWLIFSSTGDLMLGCLLFQKFKKLINLVRCQMQLECHEHIKN